MYTTVKLFEVQNMMPPQLKHAVKISEKLDVD